MKNTNFYIKFNDNNHKINKKFDINILNLILMFLSLKVFIILYKKIHLASNSKFII